MTAILSHTAHVDQQPRPDAERHSNWARWVCTCGRRSKLFTSPALAQTAADSHSHAMHRLGFDDAADEQSLLEEEARYEAGRDD